MKTAIITGVSGGMGQATAERLRKEGWSVFGLDRKAPDPAWKTLKAKHPKYVYCINRNPLLLLMHLLPKSMQTRVIKMILTK